MTTQEMVAAIERRGFRCGPPITNFSQPRGGAASSINCGNATAIIHSSGVIEFSCRYFNTCEQNWEFVWRNLIREFARPNSELRHEQWSSNALARFGFPPLVKYVSCFEVSAGNSLCYESLKNKVYLVRSPSVTFR